MAKIKTNNQVLIGNFFLLVATLENALSNLLISISLYLGSNKYIIYYIYLFFLCINLLFFFIQSQPQLSNEFLNNYIILMESSSNNPNNPGSSTGPYGAGPGFEPRPEGNPGKSVFDANTKRKHDEISEERENTQKRTRTSPIDSSSESKILNKLHNKFIKNDPLNTEPQTEKTIFPPHRRDLVLFSQDLAGNVEELGIDDNGKLNESFYDKKEPEGSCECCGKGGNKICVCGGPKKPHHSNPMPPPKPRTFITRPLCKDSGPNPGTFSREYPCCKCGKSFGNYKCSRCDCIYC